MANLNYCSRDERQILEDILDERAHQEALCHEGKFPMTCANPGMSNDAAYRILGEEVGEVAKALNENAPVAELRAELIQVAATAMSWVEKLDR